MLKTLQQDNDAAARTFKYSAFDGKLPRLAFGETHGDCALLESGDDGFMMSKNGEFARSAGKCCRNSGAVKSRVPDARYREMECGVLNRHTRRLG